MQLIAKGAEATITRDNDTIIKERIKKDYRLPELDEKIRKRRTALEARLLREARRAGVLTPQVLGEEKNILMLEFIDGQKVKDILDGNCRDIAEKIGESIAKLHNYGIIHGDLTTSNMIIKDGKIYFIDFGLGFISKRTEDKAVDLYLLHEVLESTHFGVMETAWNEILKSYKRHYQDGEKVIKALLSVEKRGRYKERSG
ncbi:MAG: Kae1-associated serine/threonine protein kinase [Candidatus Aenigmarchaeota archaeon]|nr:Kae1-associated serine/threonine protein kinase [Candidatus Aenigmarchaeota archaeon]